MLITDRNGNLWLYPGNGAGGLQSRVKMSGSWGQIEVTASVGDFNGDNKADVLAVDKKGTMWRYPGNGAGGLQTRVKVSSGWDKIQR